jgi:hypothetical protein
VVCFLALLLLWVWVVWCVFLMEVDCWFLNGVLQGRMSVVVLFPAEVADGDVTEESGVSGHYEKRYD